jgi:hypothetical protein
MPSKTSEYFPRPIYSLIVSDNISIYFAKFGRKKVGAITDLAYDLVVLEGPPLDVDRVVIPVGPRHPLVHLLRRFRSAMLCRSPLSTIRESEMVEAALEAVGGCRTSA